MRAVIAEDNVLLAEGLALLLSRAGFEVVARVVDGESFVEAAVEHRPEVAIVDVRMPPTFRDEGIRAALEARRRVPGLPVLVLSQYVETSYASELMAGSAGGVGYLLKDRVSRVEEFVDALVRVAGGGTVMDPEVVRQLLTRRASDPVDTLSPREREVLGLMAQGQDNTTIRNRLHITESSVQKHIGAIFTKLGLQPTDSGNRRVLAVLAYLDSERE
ncbi:DNA-binding response regulator, NarL/FixJ family, contains REC and HTH domains [Lentzea fradiae]|uniref:DNA-binding response regulator, NarL/FixJ family, contains REC and HTH domains n=1 Tax=Lentzea fradiae TaxID=200378 RepID=A0A1G7XK46_9PSEU|nr:response regulator transcription factor [Lentzea fradiae]SDG84588.1 DNA-binding response regulator, NarL/FixJ family, contains REC and HTH domains [Lentzea fradiae]